MLSLAFAFALVLIRTSLKLLGNYSQFEVIFVDIGQEVQLFQTASHHSSFSLSFHHTICNRLQQYNDNVMKKYRV